MYDGLFIDLLIITVLAVATASGLSRGTLREALSLCAWVVVILVVVPNFATASGWFSDILPDASLREWTVALCIIMTVATVLALLDMALHRFLARSGKGGNDPLLGLILGAIRGMLFITLGVVLAHRTALPDRFAWYQSQFVGYAEVFAQAVREHLPPTVAKQIVLRGEGATEQRIVIPRDSRGHYIARGWINGMPVRALVDTGATMVMVPKHLRYDLWLEAGDPFPVNTATGEAIAEHTTIDSIKFGPIVLYDVEAALVTSPKDTILIGMSFLRQTRFQQTVDGLLIEQARPGLE